MIDEQDGEDGIVNIERTGPVTNGQLSVLRSLEAYGVAGQAVANLISLWEVPAGANVTHVVDAWQQLVAAHESLRTSYDTGESRPVQTVWTPAAVAVPVVEVADDTYQATWRVATEWAAEPISVANAQPWRAFVAVHQGAPLYLVTIVHHVAADNGALRVLAEQFPRLVEGDFLEAQVQPLEMAVAQEGDAEGKRAVDHWSQLWGTFAAQDRQQGDISARRRATVYTVEGLRAAKDLSLRYQVSVQAVLLAVGALVLSRIKQRDRITFGLMTANRIEDHWSSIVSSLNQCTPLSMRIDEASSPDIYMRTVYEESLNAYLYGCFDVDALKSRVNGMGIDETDPTFFSSHYNFLGQGNGEPPADSPMHTSVAWRGSAQRIGPNFHLTIAVESGLFIGVGASVDFLPGDLPAVLAASIEAGLIGLADEPPESLSELSIALRRDIESCPSALVRS
ncbi:condensation domain-containing protein [Streptomyces sp. NBC_01518]|uniref:condensation domain-containing protein n=1 Tax=Streptomyces sp. NBC_01518 TaxID=2903891 RepID=UPI003867ABF8